MRRGGSGPGDSKTRSPRPRTNQAGTSFAACPWAASLKTGCVFSVNRTPAGRWLRGLLLGVAGGLLAIGVAACAVLRSAAATVEVRFEFTQPQMGVPFRMVVYAPDFTTASNAVHAAFARVAALNCVLSDYEDDSELTLLSRTAGSHRAVPVSADLWRVLVPAQRWARRTDGAFDVTVGPAVQLWRRARRQRELPSAARLATALEAVGHRKLILQPRERTAQLTVPGMRLDLGGIAKGYAVDEALRVLRAYGIQRALVSGGGDLAVSQPPPGTAGWRIELPSPETGTNSPPRFVRLKNAALATSGDLFQFVEIAGTRYSHIVDPRTGIGLTDHSQVTVIAQDCLTADALATSVSVLGVDRGFRLVEATPRAAAFLVRQPRDSREAFASRRFARFIEAPPDAVKTWR
ncbi:MAG: Thiamine biosynthesis lipoprotein ApbE precursor [Verrucomicrobia bacterium ADurb.Bin118]|nr:MAG: Thiamine biosynthesis lipoprotein ApbE precursor [Verrucomicrobia bacterium ADurb.Bin118]